MSLEDIVRRSLPLHEGIKDRVYQDTVGVPTIGIGRNLKDKGLKAAEIKVLFENDLKDAMNDLDTFVHWWKELDEVRQAVLVELMFNLGWPRLRQFKNTLEAFQDGDFDRAAEQLEDSLWYRQTKNRARRLIYMVRTGKVHPEIERAKRVE